MVSLGPPPGAAHRFATRRRKATTTRAAEWIQVSVFRIASLDPSPGTGCNPNRQRGLSASGGCGTMRTSG